ncbi:hypothetical protein BX616_000035 [Lobosporangium transversale]|uniref:Uncharacterized protein n=1 Tax=Lobosporangium transversale TaxID=64571 RepID=A0A1Y2G9X5_9FUNG|nr:hypothetical protein BCR41DRAFT_362015 [Lobosporangium transversale]KAF9919182.1 hypothetical protein BX616_000035 [Lobosporangium transversale]ORZ05153.1 hypothetical protein BCR41DRAFT_362015 [Lobosporangium transversale]|eukprot:XP_021876928.1 hypothetical protein BCR41DRAFT_362015 [Lobosporangium transversale]
MDVIPLLLQLDKECTVWAQQHAHSCNLFASLVNINRQREQTFIQWQTQQKQKQKQKQHIICSVSSSSKEKAFLASPSLQLLIHKQTLEIEAVITQLYEAIQAFRNVVQAMIKLEQQMEAAVQTMDTEKLLSSVNYIDSAIMSTTAVTSNNRYASMPSLMDTVEISPLETLDWVSRVRAMYAQELSVKQSQIHPSMTFPDQSGDLIDLQRDWGLQERIDFGLEQEIMERIKTYRRVREFSSRI